MSKYLKESMTEDETLEHQGKITPWIFMYLGIKGVAVCVLLVVLSKIDTQLFNFKISVSGVELSITATLVVFIVGLASYVISCLRTIVYVLTTEIVITNKRIFVKRGLILRNTEEVRIATIEGSSISQNILERVLKIGTLRIRGVGAQQIVINHLHNPVATRRAILNTYKV